MKTLSELKSIVRDILSTKWERREGRVIPAAESVKLGNDAVELDATVLYADLADSTGLVQGYRDWFAAEVYKAYLVSASELIRNNGGEITAFDGDRVMGVFIGDTKNSNAAKCALQINYVVTKVINPAIKSQYPSTAFELKQAVGIDTSNLFIVRTGVRKANDLAWVGNAANVAAKLCGLREGNASTFITDRVFNRLMRECKYGGEPEKLMWDKMIWEETGTVVYKSAWRWSP